MGFRLVPKSVTLNDVEGRNGRYFALFQRIRVACGRTAYKFTFAISSPDEFLFGSVNSSSRPSEIKNSAVVDELRNATTYHIV